MVAMPGTGAVRVNSVGRVSPPAICHCPSRSTAVRPVFAARVRGTVRIARTTPSPSAQIRQYLVGAKRLAEENRPRTVATKAAALDSQPVGGAIVFAGIFSGRG